MISKLSLLSFALLGCCILQASAQNERPQGHPGHGGHRGFLFGRKSKGGSGGGSKFGSGSMLKEFEKMIGKKVPITIKLQLIKGKYSALFSWLKSNRITISESEYKQMRRRLEEEKVPDDLVEQFENWYEESGSNGGSEGGDTESESETDEDATETETDEGSTAETETDSETDEVGGGGGASWKRVKFTSSQVSRIERSLKIKLPSKVKREMRAGNFVEFSRWMEKERMTISGSQWASLKRSLRLSKTNENKLNKWYKVTRGRGGAGGGSGRKTGGNGGGGARSGSRSIRKTEFRKFAGKEVPEDILQAVENRDFDSLIKWLEENEIKITTRRWKRMKDNYRSWGIESGDFNKMRSWYNRSGKFKFTGARKREVVKAFGKSFPRNVETMIEDGDSAGFITWLERNNIRLSRSQWRQISKNRGKWGFSEEFFAEIEEWYGSSGSGSSSGGGTGGSEGGGRSGSRSIRKTEFRKFAGKEVPEDILQAVENRDFVTFIEWLEENEIKITTRRWKRMKDNYRSWGIESGDFNKMRNWYNRSGKFTFTGARKREVVKAFGKSFPRNVETMIEDGDSAGFITWLERNNIRLSRSQWRQISKNRGKWGFSEEFFTEIEEWYGSIGSGGSGGGGGGDTDTDSETDSETEEGGEGEESWEQIELSETEIDEFEGSLGRRIPSAVRQKMRSGNFGAFSVWMQEENVSLSSRKWRLLKRKFRGSKLTELNKWYKKTKGRGGGGRGRGRGGGSGGSGGAGGGSGNSDLRKREFRKFAGKRVPDDVLRRLDENGDFNGFIRWLEENNIKITGKRWKRLNQNYRQWGVSQADFDEMKAWYRRNGKFSLSGKTEREARRVFGGKRFPNRARRFVEEGDSEGFISWMKTQNIKIDESNWGDFEINYEEWGFDEEFYLAIKAWYESEGRGSGGGSGGSGGSGGGRVSAQKRALFKSFVGEEMPESVQSAWESGDEDAVLEWLSSGEFEISKKQWKAFKRSYKRNGVSRAFYQKINKWYKARGSGSGGRGGRGGGGGGNKSNRSKSKSKMRKLFGRFPNKVWRQLQNDDASSLVDWLKKKNQKVSDSQWIEFEQSYSSWGYTESFFSSLMSWRESGGSDGGSDCGRPIPSAVQSQLRRAYGGELPNEMEENMDCGRVQLVLDFLENEEINISASLKAEISQWQRG